MANEAQYQAEFLLDINNAIEALQGLDQKIRKEAGAAADKGAKTFSDKFNKGIDKVAQFSFPATALLTGALAAGAVVEEGLVGVAKTTGIEKSSKEFAELKKQIKDVSKEVPVLIPNLLEIAQAAGTAGVQGVENIAAFTKTIAQLEKASDLAGEGAAKSLKRILDATHEPLDNVEELASGFVILGNTTTTTEAAIASNAERLAISSAGFNTNSRSVLAVSGTLAAMGIQAELSGSVLLRTQTEMQKAVEQGGKKLELFAKVSGKTTEQFKKDFGKDSLKAVTDFTGGFKKFEKTGGSIVQLYEDLDLSGAGYGQVLGALAGQHEQLLTNQKNVNEQFENATALTEEAAAGGDTFKSKMILMTNAITNLGDSVAQAGVLDFMTGLVMGTTEIINIIGELPDPVLAAGTAFLGFVAISPKVKTAFNAISKATKLLGGRMKTFLLFSGIGAIAAVILDLWSAFKGGDSVLADVASWFGVDLQKALQGSIEWIKKTWEWFGSLIDKAKEFFGIDSEGKNSEASSPPLSSRPVGRLQEYGFSNETQSSLGAQAGADSRTDIVTNGDKNVTIHNDVRVEVSSTDPQEAASEFKNIFENDVTDYGID